MKMIFITGAKWSKIVLVHLLETFGDARKQYFIFQLEVKPGVAREFAPWRQIHWVGQMKWRHYVFTVGYMNMKTFEKNNFYRAAVYKYARWRKIQSLNLFTLAGTDLLRYLRYLITETPLRICRDGQTETLFYLYRWHFILRHPSPPLAPNIQAQ